jgi:hypothetical protein
MRRINNPSWTEIFCCIARMGGGETIGLSEEEAREYDADPDLWAARYYDFDTVEQYHEWIDHNGVPMCGAINKAGKPCGCEVAGNRS